eukprot:9479434-Pyramimonas_sp.AAC.2
MPCQLLRSRCQQHAETADESERRSALATSATVAAAAPDVMCCESLSSSAEATCPAGPMSFWQADCWMPAAWRAICSARGNARRASATGAAAAELTSRATAASPCSLALVSPGSPSGSPSGAT